MPTEPPAKSSTFTPTRQAPLLWQLIVSNRSSALDPNLSNVYPPVFLINPCHIHICLSLTIEKKTDFGNPINSPFVPDIIVQPDLGIIYTTSKKKVEEHGGLSADDRNVACFVSSPRLSRRAQKFPQRVSTRQIAPLILEALGIDGGELEGVRAEGTRFLPGFEW